MIILIGLAFPPLCLSTSFSFTYFTAAASWLPPFLQNVSPFQMFSLPYPASALGEPNGVLSTSLQIRVPPGLSLIFLWALNIESILSFPFAGCWVPCTVHAAPQTGTTSSVSASASEGPSVWALCLGPVWLSSCPTEADPSHHVSSVPSPNVWLGPVLQKKDDEEVSFYLPVLPDSFPSLVLEEKRSLLPLEDQFPPGLPAGFPASPAAGCSRGLLVQCWSSLGLTILLFPLLSLFFPYSSFFSYWFSTLFLRDALQSLALVAPGISPSHVIIGIHSLTLVFLLIGELRILNIYLHT